MPQDNGYVSPSDAFQALVDISNQALIEKTEYGYLGIVNEDATAYEFFVENEPGYVHCRIEKGAAFEFAKCIPRVALIPYIRCRFERVNGTLEAKEFVGPDAIRVLGDSAPGAGVPSPPLPGFGAVYPPPVFNDPETKIIGADDKVSVATDVTAGLDVMKRYLILQPASGSADNLIEIEGLEVGDVVVITPTTSAGITIKHDDAGATDKILLYNETDLLLNYPQVLMLFKRAAGQVVQPVDEKGGGGTGTLLYERWDVDAPPASPNADDDEFEGAVSGSWTDFDHGSTMTYAADPTGKGVRMVFAQVATEVCGLLKAPPAGDFSFMTHLHASTVGANRIMGLILADGSGASDDFYIFLLSGAAAGSDSTLQLHYYTDYNSFSSSVFSHQVGGVGVTLGCFLRVRRVSTTYYFDFSMDGRAWININSNTLSNIASLDFIGIGGASNNAAAGDLIVSYDFFRVTTNVDLDAPVSGQAVGIYAPP